MSNTSLSKSLFIKGLQCHKQLWLYKKHPELKDLVDKSLENIFQTGQEVGELATQLFPGGKMLPCEDLSLSQQIKTTRQWLEQGVTTIYEAAFSENEVFVRVDILHKGADGWEIYEVKSSTEPKPVYIQDVAAQTWVLKQAGLNISKSALVTLDNCYQRQGEVDIQKLFTIHDLTQKANGLQGFVKSEVSKMQGVLQLDTMPKTVIGHHCNKPYQCAFYGYCHGKKTETSVFNLGGIGKLDSYALYHSGQTHYADIDLNQLGWRQRLQVDSYLKQTNHVQIKNIEAFLDSLWYPLCYLDFETTYMVAVPMFEGTRPYQQVPFQFSLHIQREPNGPTEHVEFLAKTGEDPRRSLLEKLLSAIPKDACILAYNKGFEERCLRNLAQEVPDYAKRVQPLFNTMRDLMIPFLKKDIYYWKMNGSYSLKKVLPALLPEMGYADLEIGDGGTAASSYLKMWRSQDPEEIATIGKNLLKYCELDTFAMVKLLEKLHSLVEIGRNKNTDNIPSSRIMLSAALKVEKVSRFKLKDCTEFHIDCLTKDPCGEALEVQLYFGLSSPEEITALSDRLKTETIFSVKDEPVCCSGEYLWLPYPNLLPYISSEGSDTQQHSENSCSNSSSQTVKGIVSEYKVLTTFRNQPLGVATIETESGFIEAFIFPETFQRHRNNLKIGETLFFTGVITLAEKTDDGIAKMAVEAIHSSGREECIHAE